MKRKWKLYQEEGAWLLIHLNCPNVNRYIKYEALNILTTPFKFPRGVKYHGVAAMKYNSDKCIFQSQCDDYCNHFPPRDLLTQLKLL